MKKTQLSSTVLIVALHGYTYLYINNTLSVCLTNQILEQSLTLLFFLNH